MTVTFPRFTFLQPAGFYPDARGNPIRRGAETNERAIVNGVSVSTQYASELERVSLAKEYSAAHPRFSIFTALENTRGRGPATSEMIQTVVDAALRDSRRIGMAPGALHPQFQAELAEAKLIPMDPAARALWTNLKATFGIA